MFAAIRENVDMRSVAGMYGYDVTHTRFIRCPFHNDTKPSLKIYSGTRGWYCFVCAAGGSVIDFVAKLYSLSPLDAAKKIDNDFRLGLSDKPAPSRKEMSEIQRAREEEARRLAEYRAEYDAKCREYRDLREATMQQKPFYHDEALECASALERLEFLDYWFSENPWR